MIIKFEKMIYDFFFFGFTHLTLKLFRQSTWQYNELPFYGEIHINNKYVHIKSEMKMCKKYVQKCTIEPRNRV